MSKHLKPILPAILALAAFAAATAAGQGKALSAKVVLDAAAQGATVEGRWESLSGGRRNLSFLASGIGAPDLAARISSVKLATRDGRPVAFRRFNPAEYVAEEEYDSFSYRIDLRPLPEARSAAHTSWVSGNTAVLFADDLLPLVAGHAKSAELVIERPAGWNTVAADDVGSDGRYLVRNLERSVFVIGNGIRESRDRENRIAVSGSWHFEDSDVLRMAQQIGGHYEDVLGRNANAANVLVIPFPQASVQPGTWEAETRGSTVIIVSSDMPFKSQSLQRLHEQLRHEIFHLWFPNASSLTGRYDWFYEGFALYLSLRAGVALNQIRFDDMLDTLSRAHNIDRLQAVRRPVVDASGARWAGAETEIYARGMLIAFLCDLALLSKPGSRGSVERMVAAMFKEFGPGKPAEDGNAAVLRLMIADPELAQLARSYVTGAQPIDWAVLLEAAGLENDPSTARTRLRVKAKLNGRQKGVLDKLGYNNWRRLTQK